eukprot:Protomagalhaensia_sp_Gyna_25__2936@NODE_2722_length_926_cov_293_565953_g2270_i0_p1_GENE_NODE_2722_length_926_cov_293_565953_g2270_i0NODE_2722_length_926_cov_293_565953_g2270_i0_p1_ORF_typecomplete_len196_score18_57_NODE_2722_length_926_cov_293_565953_g2270_i0256843
MLNRSMLTGALSRQEREADPTYVNYTNAIRPTLFSVKDEDNSLTSSSSYSSASLCADFDNEDPIDAQRVGCFGCSFGKPRTKTDATISTAAELKDAIESQTTYHRVQNGLIENGEGQRYRVVSCSERRSNKYAPPVRVPVDPRLRNLRTPIMQPPLRIPDIRIASNATEVVFCPTTNRVYRKRPLIGVGLDQIQC